MKLKWLGVLLGFALLPKVYGAEATVPETTPKDTASAVKITYDDPRDPFEGFNRAMWDFNYLYLDRYIYRPVAHGYNDYLPLPAKTGINNFVQNLEEPSSLVNNALQGKWGWAANAGGRFTVTPQCCLNAKK
jgi:Surface lipoprotein